MSLKTTPNRETRFFSHSVQNITDSIFWFDKNSRVVWANDAACHSLGYTRKELIGKKVSDFDPIYETQIWPGYWERIKQHRSMVFESIHRNNAGLEFPVEIRDSLIEFEGEDYTCSIVRNLSTQKEKERHLRLSDFTVEFAYNPIFWIDSKSIIRRVNDTACKRYGYTQEELTGMSILEINTIHDLDDYRKRFEEMRQKKVNVFESTHKKKDGTIIPVEISMKHMEFEGEEFTCSFVVDLREKKRTEQALKALTEGTAATTGSAFFRALAKSLTETFGVEYAFITEAINTDKTKVRTLAFVKQDKLLDNIRYNTEGLPCKQVLDGKTVYYPSKLKTQFPKEHNYESYLGVPIHNSSGAIVGHLAVFDTLAFNEGEKLVQLMQIFAARAGAEIERLSAEDNLRIALEEVERLRDRLKAENVYLQEEIKLSHNFEEIKSQNKPFIEILNSVQKVAGTDATVLLMGETGTGKELLARAVHNTSNRSDRPLVKINCAALPENLIESELFGHDKGAFTGAVASKAGRFELADKGTLFLDEIGELPLDLQAKILRAIQDGEFERVGGTKTKKVNVRIIAATNRKLKKEVDAGNFRADLFYRLNVFPINIPPLRERKEDIPLLVKYFVQKYSKQTKKQINTIPQKVMDRLVAYAWPGNIRELENIIERAIIITPGKSLQIGDWLPKSDLPISKDSISTIAQNEKQHILDALDITGWRVSGNQGAAKLLDIKSTTLEYRMKKLGISRR